MGGGACEEAASGLSTQTHDETTSPDGTRATLGYDCFPRSYRGHFRDDKKDSSLPLEFSNTSEVSVGTSITTPAKDPALARGKGVKTEPWAT